MRRTSFDTMRCSIARTLDVVGDPWTLLVVREAFFGTSRFDDFQRNLGIPAPRCPHDSPRSSSTACSNVTPDPRRQADPPTV